MLSGGGLIPLTGGSVLGEENRYPLQVQKLHVLAV